MPNNSTAFYFGVGTGTLDGIGADANAVELTREAAQHGGSFALDQLATMMQILANLLSSVV